LCIEKVASTGNASDFYSGGAQFESRPRRRLSWGVSWFCLVPTDKSRDDTIK
jgi:hypothetical protein